MTRERYLAIILERSIRTTMKQSQKIKLVLGKKFKKVKETPANFAFFVSIHDFIAFIESTPSFKMFLKKTGAASRISELPLKYFLLEEIHQGIEDLDQKTTEDLGHNRYVAIRELNLIRNNDVSDSNSFWKRREAFRKIAEETYKVLDARLSQ